METGPIIRGRLWVPWLLVVLSSSNLNYGASFFNNINVSEIPKWEIKLTNLNCLQWTLTDAMHGLFVEASCSNLNDGVSIPLSININVSHQYNVGSHISINVLQWYCKFNIDRAPISKLMGSHIFSTTKDYDQNNTKSAQLLISSSIRQNIARIANAVQVTIFLLVSTSVY